MSFNKKLLKKLFKIQNELKEDPIGSHLSLT